jgi:hypothetical protein
LGKSYGGSTHALKEYLAARQLSQLEQGIARCDQIADDMTAASERRGQARIYFGFTEPTASGSGG